MFVTATKLETGYKKVRPGYGNRRAMEFRGATAMKARTLVDSYREEAVVRPELVLETKLDEKMKSGLTMDQAIEQLYGNSGLNG